MPEPIGAYICSGCGLGDALDAAALAALAQSEGKARVARVSPALCAPAEKPAIAQDIEQHGLGAVVIAACSPRCQAAAFAWGENVLVERVNLREQAAWCHAPRDEDTRALAGDALRLSLVKARATAIPTPSLPTDPSRAVLVVGGGLTGLTASLAAAGAGYPVILVEKEDTLGGWLKGLYQLAPARPPYTEPEDNDLPALVATVTSHPGIRVYTGAVIEKTAGGPAGFNVTIRQGELIVAERAGAVVVATGAQPYNPERLQKIESLGFGRCPGVITAAALEELAIQGQGAIRRPADGRPVRRAAFIQCAGSRDLNHLPYCSAECCLETCKQALYLKAADPATAVYVLYKDLRVTGQHEALYRQAQSRGVVFIKADDISVAPDGADLVITCLDRHLGERLALAGLDLVVLATGMVTSAAQHSPDTLNPTTPLDGRAGDCSAPAQAPLASSILNLDYRQGPELPAGRYGFPDSHFICFPYETGRTGVYAAGCVRQPMDRLAAISDAAGAALKAIQCLELAAQGRAVHPRSLEIAAPDFALARCTQCQRCTEECPFGALNEDAKLNPVPHLSRCRRCGTCLGACPERLVSFPGLSPALVSAMIKALPVPGELEEKPRLLVFACQNDAYPALDLAGAARLCHNPWVRVIPLPCLGSLNLIWIADALAQGFDGVLLLGCRGGADYQCHFIRGSDLAAERLTKIAETLDRMRLEAERVRFEAVSLADWPRLPALLDGFAGRLLELGPNPLKGL